MSLIAVCFGEVLWDIFPEHKKIGGAPLNVALRLNSFGIDSIMVSKIGNDQNGFDIIDYVGTKGISGSFIQIDESYKTGEVYVILDKNGSASYDINYPVAWDKIDFNSKLKKLVLNADVFIFGSLICRDVVSKKTLFNALKLSKFKVFDVNLRVPYYDHMVLLELMKLSDFIKFNAEEIIEVCNYNQLKNNSLEDCIKSISNLTNTHQICVTLGSKGAVLYLNKSFYYHQGIKVEVVDTVGAGDSFLGSLIFRLLNGEKPQHALNFACVVGALVASNNGANPELDSQQINQLLTE